MQTCSDLVQLDLNTKKQEVDIQYSNYPNISGVSLFQVLQQMWRRMQKIVNENGLDTVC